MTISFLSNGTVSLDENAQFVIDIEVSDTEGDTEGSGIVYTITGGDDAALFEIDPDTGALTFKYNPDFENPFDADRDNVYDVEVTATNSQNDTAAQSFAITVTDTNDDIAGLLLGTKTQISTGSHYEASVTALANGNVAIVWEGHANDRDIFLSIRGTDGSLVSATGIAVNNNTGGNQLAPMTTALDDGGFIVVWADNGWVVAQRFDASGTEVEINGDAIIDGNGQFYVADSSSGSNAVPTVTQLENGDIAFAWVRNNEHVRYTIIEEDTGSTVLADTNLNSWSSVTVADISALQDGSGGFVIMWTRDAGNLIETSVLDASGAVVASSTPFVSGSSGYAYYQGDMTTLAGGGYVMTWTDASVDGNSYGIKAALFDSDANYISDFQVNTQNVGAQVRPTVTSLDKGGFVISWIDGYGGSPYTIRAQAFDSNGNAAGDELVLDTLVHTDNWLTGNWLTEAADGTLVAVTPGQGTGSYTNMITMTVNYAPAITSTAAVTVSENVTDVVDIDAEDSDGDTEGAGLTYAITGGADQALFTIDTDTGELSFLSAPDYEAPTDDGADNVYDVEVTVTDSDNGTGVQALQVTVTDLSDSPVGLQNATTQTVVLGTVGWGSVSALSSGRFVAVTDISGGPNGSQWDVFATIYNADGTVFRAITSAPINNNIGGYQYESGSTALDDGGFIIGWYDNNSKITLQRFDAAGDEVELDGSAISDGSGEFDLTDYTGIFGGPDLHTVDSDHIIVSWHDFTGAGRRVIFEIIELSTGAKDASIVIPSVSGEEMLQTSIEQLAGGDFVVTWVEAGTTTLYAQRFDSAGGEVDAEPFAIATGTDLWAWNSIASREDGSFIATWSKSDGSGLGVYAAIVDANGNVGTEFLVNTLTSGDQKIPSVVTLADGSFVIGYMSDTQVHAQLFDASGNKVGSEFVVDAARGTTSYLNDGNWLAQLEDGSFAALYRTSGGASVAQFELQSANPVITTSAAVSVAENTTDVIDIETTDGDSEGAGLTYAITGGADAALFTIDADTGELSFVSAPDYENPADDGADNVYDVQVTVTDSSYLTDVQDLQVTVSDAGEPAVITGDTTGAVTEDDVQTSVSGTLVATDEDSGDDGFTAATIAGSYGSLSIDAAGEWMYTLDNTSASVDGLTGGEALTDTITVQSADGTEQDITVTINGANDAPAFVIPGATVISSVAAGGSAERPNITALSNGGTAAILNNAYLSITDGAGNVVFNGSIAASPVGGNAGGVVDLGNGTFAVSWVVNRSDVYIRIVEYDGTPVTDPILAANDGGAVDYKNALVGLGGGEFAVIYARDAAGGGNITIRIFDQDGVPQMASVDTLIDTQYGSALRAGVLQNGNIVIAYQGDLNQNYFQNASFAIFQQDGTFVSVHEVIPELTLNPNAGDVGLAVLSDGRFVVSYTTLDETGDLTVYGQIYNEDGSADGLVFEVASWTLDGRDGDYDGQRNPEVTALADGGFAIIFENTRYAQYDDNGVLQPAGVFYQQYDSDGAKVGDYLHVTTGLNVAVATSDDGTVFVVNQGGTVYGVTPQSAGTRNISHDENSTDVVVDLDATDAEGDVEGSGLTYSLTGGADQALFAIDANTGELTFNSAPDYETPLDSDTDNVYELEITVTDSLGATDVQSLTVTIGNVNEAPVVSGPVTLPASDEDAAVTITQAQLIANASDVDGDELTVSSLVASSGTLVDNLDGTWTFTPDQDDNTAVTLTYNVTDGSLAEPTTATLDLLPVNDAPVISTAPAEQSFLINSASNTITGLSFNDVDGDDVTVTLKVQGTLTLAQTTGLTFSTGDGADDSEMTFTGSLADVNAAVATLTYTPANGDTDGDALDVGVSDGNTFGPVPGTFAPSFDLSALDGSNGFVIKGIDADDNSGRSVSNGGDLNGDGVDDLLIGAYPADPNGNSSAGETYVVFGGTGVGTSGSLDLSALDGTNGFVINGIDAGDDSGYSVSTAGDVNGDGVDDLLIGASDADPNGTERAGETYVVFGGTGVGALGSIDLSNLDGINGFVINGIDESDQSGISVSNAGDVNGDGVDDLLIGARQADPNGNSRAGETYVVFGGTGVGASGSIDLSSLNGTNGFVINGIDESDDSGISVSHAGDVNGDGVDDLLIGAYHADPNGNSSAGETYVVFGGTGVGASGSIDLSSLDGSNGFVINGIDASDFSGQPVSSAGDVNGDGVDDLLIGAYGGDPNGNSSAGETYVVFGGTGVGTSGSIDLSSLNGTNGFVINGIDYIDLSGYSVSNAGDVNGDGVDDLLIGATYADPNGNGDAGETYVVFGGTGVGALGSIDLSSLDGTNGFVINGADASDSSGYSVSAAGDVNGDGVDDMLIGAIGADPNGQGLAGETYVIYGSTDIGEIFTTQSITINLTNTDPVAADDDLTASEDGPAITGSLFADNGNGADSDSDGQTFTITEVNGEAADVGSEITLASGALLTVNSDGTYSYSPNGQYESLNVGDTATDTFTYTISDGATGTDTATVTVTINGVNDAATFSGDTTGAITEDASPNTVSGTLTASDVDNTDDTFTAATIAGTYGSLSIDAAGAWTYTLDNANATVDALQVGDTLTDTIAVASEDGTTQDVTVTINGANDAAIISGDVTGSVTEDSATTTATGQLAATDADNIDDAFTAATVAGAYGSLTIDAAGAWTYTLDNANASVNGLDTGETLTDVISVTSVDGTSQDVTVTINGTNDEPEIVVPAQQTFKVNSAANEITGLSVSDAEGDTLTVKLTVEGTISLAQTIGLNFAVGDGADDSTMTFSGSVADINAAIATLSYTPVHGDLDGDTLLVEVSDGQHFGGRPAFGASFDLSDLDGTNGFVINGESSSDRSGWSVSAAGDVNGDGFDDVIIGAYQANSGGLSDTGKSYVVFGGESGSAVLDLTNLDGTNGFAIAGDAANDLSGYDVSSAGDVNGDGVDDVMVSAYLAHADGDNGAGQTYVIFGTTGTFSAELFVTDLDGTNGFTIEGIDPSDWSGFSIDSAGDVNGDGVDDLLIGAHYGDGSVPTGDEGEAYVVFGSTDGFQNSFALSDLNGSNGFRIDGDISGGYAGSAVGAGGDVNGDGFADVIVGAYNANSGTGQSYVIFGSSAHQATLQISDLDGSNGFRINGESSGDNAGTAVDLIGDVNGDGIDDILVGAQFSNGAAGQSYVVFGSTDGFSADFDLSSINGSNGFSILGIRSNDWSGYAVSSLGDVNGDGIDDLLIGSFFADTSSGDSYVVFGSSTGFNSELQLSNLDGSNGFIINGVDNNDRSGFAVSAAGDVDGDGVDDILIGAHRADPNGDQSGESYIVYGSSGISETFTADTVNIVLENAPPVAADDAVSVSEDGPALTGDVLADNGNGADTDAEGATLTITEVNGEAADVGSEITLSSGALLTLNSDGTFSYNPNGQYESLGVGETTTDSFTYVVADPDGASDTATVTVTINGVNDAPVITGSLSVPSGVDLTGYTYNPANGHYYLFVDGDFTEAQALAGAAAAGGYLVTITSEAEHNFVLGVAAGEEYRADGSDADTEGTWVFTNGPEAGEVFWQSGIGTMPGYYTNWGSGEPNDANANEHSLLIYFDGVWNDYISGDSRGAYIIEVGSAPTTDEDSGLSFSEARLVGVASDVEGDTLSVSAINTDATNGSAVLNGDGSITYDTNDAYEYLNEGDTATDTFTYTISDGNGGEVDYTATVTITGINDAAVISGDISAAVAEDDATDTVSGQLAHTDVDNTDDVFTAATVAGLYGSLSIDAAGAWTYTLDNANATVDALNVGDSLTDTITVTAEDGTPQLITVTINGANDAAIISGVNTGSVAEDDATDTVSGQLTHTDVDNTDDVFTAATIAGLYGSLSIDAAGAWTYTLDNNNGDVDALNVGDSLTDTITVTAEDGTTQDITVTINGANDAAIISGDVAGAVTEDDATDTVSGQLTHTDVDNTDDVFTAATVAGLYGSLSIDAAGAWTYTLDNTNATVDALNVGDSLTDTITVTAEDGTAQNIVVTVNGTNDAALISGTTSGSVTENAATDTVSGQLTHTDVDNTDDVFTAATVAGLYGSLSIDAAGAWTYTLDNTNATVDALNARQTLSDVITVTAEDGTEQAITVTIRGANDRAIVSGDVTGEVTENDADNTFVGQLTATDADNADDTFRPATLMSYYGTVSVTESGEWTYTLDNDNLYVNALDTGETLDDYVAVITTDGTIQNLFITIYGDNDAPEISTPDDMVFAANSTDNGISNLSLFDPEGHQPVTVTLTVGGTLSVTSTTGIIFLTGDGTDDATMSFTGTEAAVNAALATLIYTPTSGDRDDDTLVVVSDDGYETRTETFDISVENSNPVPADDDFTFDETGSVETGDLFADNGNGKDADANFDAFTITEVNGDAANVGSQITLASGALLTINSDGTYSYDRDGQFEYLQDGETVVETVTYQIEDAYGGSGTATVTITITGENDPALIEGDFTGSVVEDDVDATTASGVVTATDVDNTDDVFTAETLTGLYGSLAIDAAGAWTYTLDNANGDVDALNVGDSLTDVITIQSEDGTTQDITITIDGTNDAAIVAGDVSVAIGEDKTPDTVSGQLTHTDVDNDDDTFVTFSQTGAYGALVMDAAGAFTYTLDNANGDVDALNVGDSLTDIFTIETGDGTTQDITVTINGANDAAIISGVDTGAVTEDDATDTVSGQLTHTDVDNTDDVFTAATVAGFYGSLSIDAAGAWTYTLDNANGDVDALNVGDSLTDTITVTAEDGTEHSVVVTITGANDAAVIVGDTSGSVTESADIATPPLGVSAPTPTGNTISGQLTHTDVDNDDNIFVGETIAGLYGSLVINAGGEWTYTLDDTNGDVDALNVGDTLTDVITVQSEDGTTQDVTVTINGANDAAIISGDVSGAVAEDDATDTVSGQLAHTDVDNTDDVFTAATVAGLYGSLSIDAAGAWTYTLDNANATVDALNVGDSLTDTITVTAEDGTPQLITVTINGANDAAIISGVNTGSVAEDDATDTVSGQLTHTDVDNTDDVFTAATVAGLYGSLSIDAAGAWTYTLDNNNATVDALNVGDSLTDTITVSAEDGTEQSIAITINGANDAAIITGDVVGVVTEAGSTPLPLPKSSPLSDSVSGQLLSSDVDNDDNVFVGETITGLYGSLVISAGGEWTYTLDDTNGDVDALNVGDTLTDVITVQSVDGTTQNISVTINGTNDAAVFSGDTSGSITEDATPNTVSGDLDNSDVDNTPDTFAASSQTGLYGSFVMDTAGAWTYTLDNTNSTVDALQIGDTLTETFTVVSEEGSTQDITVTINGANDAPTITGRLSDSSIDLSGFSLNPDNGHYYQFVEAGVSYAGAEAAAEAAGGYLVTITSAIESAFVVALAGGRSFWASGSDADTEGEWVYTTGPEAGQIFWKDGVSLAFTNWFASEPNDSNGGEDALLVLGNGTWNDGVTGTVATQGYIIEFSSGLTSDEDSGLSFSQSNLVAVATDVEGDTLAVIAIDTTSTTGSAVLNGDGSIDYDASGAFDALNVGDTATDTFTYTISDGHGGTVDYTATITITGVNDAAIIVGDTSGSVTESADIVPPPLGVRSPTPTGDTVSGQLTHTDVDNDDNVFVGETIAGLYGSLVINAGGEWVYTLDDTNGDVDALNVGDTLTDTITVTAEDGTAQDITVTINGANDAAIISGDVAGAVAEDDATDTVSGQLTHTDVDNTDDVFTAATIAGLYGSLSIDAAGAWTYTLDNANATVDALNVGDSLTDTITVTAEDGTAQNIAVTINGTNDAAIISGVNTGSVAEDDATDTVSGQLTHTDVDNTDDVFTAATVAGLYGSLSIDAAGAWTYTLDNNNATVDALNVGDSLTDTITVTAEDGTEHSVVVTINGANDAAIISGVDTGSVTEDDATDTVSGQLTHTDVDNTDDVFTAATVAGLYGSLSIDAAGAWTYTLDNTNGDVDALNVGDSLTDTLTITAEDGTEHSVVVEINGANDAAVFGGDLAGTVTEDQTATITGTATADDVDNVSDVFLPENAVGDYGSFAINAAGEWSYTLDNTNTDVDALNDGDQLTDSFEVTTNDGSTQNIVVTINGANDRAIIAGDLTGHIVEDSATNTVTGTATSTDVDNTDDVFRASTMSTYFGSIVFGADGEWTYTLDNSNAAVTALNVGDVLYDFAVIVSEDQTPHLITITIDGANDAAVITGDTSASLTGAGVDDTAAGQLSHTDVDNTDDVFTAATLAGLYGSLIIDAAGAWTYTIDNANPVIAAMNGTDTLVETISVQAEDGTAQDIEITINGPNQAPELTAPTSTSVNMNSFHNRISGLSVSDAEDGLLTVTLSVNGNLTLGVIDGLTFLTGDGYQDSDMSFSGSVSDINAALKTLMFDAVVSSLADDVLTITVDDGELSDSGTISIDVLHLERDFDRNGTVDLMFVGANGMYYRLLDPASGGAAETEGRAGYDSVGLGDLDGDGQLDNVIQAADGRFVVQFNGDNQRSVVLPALPIEIVGFADLDGDGAEEVLAKALGANPGYLLIDDNASSIEEIGFNGYEFHGFADFDGDGDLDLLMEGGGVKRIFDDEDGVVSVGKGNFECVGIGDFDGDGDADVLGRHVVRDQLYIMQGGETGTLRATDEVGFGTLQAVAFGDFDGDGKTDMLGYQDGSGYRSLVNGLTTLVNVNFGNDTFEAIGDFNGDGQDDFLLSRPNGQGRVVFSGDRSDTALLSALMGHSVMDVADYDGDGKDDLLIKDDVTGEYSILLEATGAEIELDDALDNGAVIDPYGLTDVWV